LRKIPIILVFFHTFFLKQTDYLEGSSEDLENLHQAENLNLLDSNESKSLYVENENAIERSRRVNFFHQLDLNILDTIYLTAKKTSSLSLSRTKAA
jgi:hypothetical protein